MNLGSRKSGILEMVSEPPGIWKRENWELGNADRKYSNCSDQMGHGNIVIAFLGPPNSLVGMDLVPLLMLLNSIFTSLPLTSHVYSPRECIGIGYD